MGTYVKTIEAEQFNGDIEALKDFIGKDGQLESVEDRLILTTPTKVWNVAEGDYLVKEYNGIAVFKEPRFLKDYDYVLESKPETKEEKPSPDVKKVEEVKTEEKVQANSGKGLNNKDKKSSE